MRKIVAALQVSVDGFIEGPKGELDWARAEDDEVWADVFEHLSHTNTLILGRVMYPAYEQYWLAVLANPAGVLPFSGRELPRTKSAMLASPTRLPTSSSPGPWTMSPGRRRGSFETWKRFAS